MSNDEVGKPARRYLGHHPTHDSEPHITYSVGDQIAGWNYVEIVPISRLETLSTEHSDMAKQLADANVAIVSARETIERLTAAVSGSQ